MSDTTNEPQGSQQEPEFLYCPYCTGGNLLDATKCRWCRRPLGPDAEPQPKPQQGTEHTTQIPLEQVYCRHCKGGNPPGDLRCIWCKRPLNLEAAAAELPPSPNLIESYKRAVIAPSLLRYTAEVPNASWRKIWLSLGIAAAASSLIGAAQVLTRHPVDVLLAMIGSAIGVVTAFSLNALPLYGIAKLFGGKGRSGKFGPDFLVHAYLIVLSFPIYSIITDLLLAIPQVGSCIALLLSLYQLYLYYFVIQVSRQLTPSNAVATLVTFIVAGVFLVLCAVGLVLGLYLSQQTSLFSQIGSGLGP